MFSANPAIRSLVQAASLVILVLVLASLALLLRLAAALEDAVANVARDTRGAAVADDLEVAVLTFQRFSNLSWVTGDPDVAAAREEQHDNLLALLEQLPVYQGGAEEGRLIESLNVSLPDFVARRRDLDTAGLELEEVLVATSAMLEETLQTIRTLRTVNDRQVEEASSRAAQAARQSAVIAAILLALLVTSMLLVAAGVRRYLSAPILALHGAMAAFRGGDLAARGTTSGARELRGLSEMFNEMAATLAQQRRAQLEFLGGVAHDLKNPLSTLKNGIYLLAQESDAWQRNRTRRMLDTQIDLLVRMIDDFLDGARIEAGELELRCIEFDSRHLARDLVAAYAALVPNRRLVLDSAADPMVLNADPLRIEQVLRNLLSNAIKYSSDGPVTLRVRRSGGDAVFEVEDHGLGIAPEDRSSIFLPFRRRHLEVAPGVGLGLSVVRRIVLAHGGRIEVDSEVGKGSTFRVLLPLSRG